MDFLQQTNEDEYLVRAYLAREKERLPNRNLRMRSEEEGGWGQQQGVEKRSSRTVVWA